MSNGFSAANLPDCYAATEAAAIRSRAGTLVVTLGAGTRGVVLAPISWGDACDWKRQALDLASEGYRVAALSWGNERGQSMLDAVEALLESGVREVVLVGACAGGTAALNQAARVPQGVKGVVAVSPLVSVAGISVGPAFADYAGPVLLLGTDHDPLTPTAALRDIDRMRPVRSQVIVLKGDQHGADIFNAPAHAPAARRALGQFLTTAFGG